MGGLNISFGRKKTLGHRKINQIMGLNITRGAAIGDGLSAAMGNIVAAKDTDARHANIKPSRSLISEMGESFPATNSPCLVPPASLAKA